MSTRYRWHKTISNPYLGTHKVIRGMTKAEVEQKAMAQLAAWSHQEGQRRAKYDAQRARAARETELQILESQAVEQNREVQTQLGRLRELLVRGLNSGRRFQWSHLKQNRQYSLFQFSEQPPTYDHVARSLRVPAPQPLLESVFVGRRRQREEAESRAHEHFRALLRQHEMRKEAARKDHSQRKLAYERAQNEYNTSIDTKRDAFERGDPEAVTWFVQRVLDELALPEGYGKDSDVAFDAASGIVVINMQMPTLEEVPRISGYRFVKARRAIDAVEMKPKDFDALYDALIHQIALLTMHQVFREAYTHALQSIVFNGRVTGVDRKTGNDFPSCIISVQASRTEFQALNLKRVDPKECIRSLKGLVAGPLAQLAPVRPILDLNRDDKRFVESREVLATVDSMDNLATMDWEDFEHLVRELFAQEFGSEGAEVRVTQASRDRGVDAIAFDPDPIRGGKFVIQAKRYNNVVPVSAVRDLYGTVINEGAVKGILVTTSHFGHDAREFAKDKPLTLIDGSNLVHMFQKHGYAVRIETQ